jgi:hypothetical protein
MYRSAGRRKHKQILGVHENGTVDAKKRGSKKAGRDEKQATEKNKINRSLRSEPLDDLQRLFL